MYSYPPRLRRFVPLPLDVSGSSGKISILSMLHPSHEAAYMSITKNDLDAFHEFAESRLAKLSPESLHELVDIWEIEHERPDIVKENKASVAAAVRDMQNGDRGRPATIVVDELRAEISHQAAQ
jgi:hypothetical protein